ncbi:MAG: hypothetical protein NC355_08245 [Blautia sp.]|nr:hypothetical protein [Blautia sp.]
MKRKQIKALIELSGTYEEANQIIETYAVLSDKSNYSQKIAFLSGMFDCEIVGRNVESEEADYKALLTSIIEQKWKN